MLVILMPVLLLSTCALGEIQRPNGGGESRTVTIAATGGFYNYFLPWDYLSDMPYEGGSLAQAASVIRELRENKNIILIDCGDSMNGNAGDLFFNDPVEPMAAGMNALNYDACAAGDLDFISGPERFQKLKRSLDAPFLAANIYQADGARLADDCAVIERGGLRVGIFGLVTPDAVSPDAMSGCTVSDPSEEARRIIDEYRDQCDLFIAVVHAPDSVDHALSDSSGDLDLYPVSDLAAACPELDLILSPPADHNIQDLSVITLSAELSGGEWSVTDTGREIYNPRDYAPDPDLSVRLDPYDGWAKETVRAGY